MSTEQQRRIDQHEKELFNQLQMMERGLKKAKQKLRAFYKNPQPRDYSLNGDWTRKGFEINLDLGVREEKD